MGQQLTTGFHNTVLDVALSEYHFAKFYKHLMIVSRVLLPTEMEEYTESVHVTTDGMNEKQSL